MKDISKPVIGYIITGVIMIFSGFILYQLFMNLIYPWISSQFNALNFVVIILVSALIPMFIVKLLFSMASMKIRVFVTDEKYSPVDSLLPVWSEFKWYTQYISMLSGVFIPERKVVKRSDGTEQIREDWSGVEVSQIVALFSLFVGKMIIILPVVFFSVLIVVGIYLYFTDGLYMLMSSHVVWMFSLLIIYNLYVTNKSFAFGLICLSLQDFIISYNPIKFIVAPFIVPVFVLGYTIAFLIAGFVFGINIQLPIFNLIVLIGIPVINPIMTWWNTRLIANECKRTINEQRIKNGERPFIW